MEKILLNTEFYLSVIWNENKDEEEEEENTLLVIPFEESPTALIKMFSISAVIKNWREVVEKKTR